MMTNAETASALAGSNLTEINSLYQRVSDLSKRVEYLESALTRMGVAFAPVTELPVCPECRAGKHGNCDRTAWDVEKDHPVLCGCSETGHDYYGATAP